MVKDWIKRIDEADGGLDSFSKAYKYYGIHIQADNSVIAREWAPGAQQLYLTGDFSEWNFSIAIFLRYSMSIHPLS